MTNAERERLKDSLRGMIDGRGDGIDLDTQFRWVVEQIKQPEPFFASLPFLLPTDAILYFEGTTIAPEIAGFYELHRASNAVAVARDTIFPIPDVFHVAFSPGVAEQLRELAANRPWPAMFDHIKAYQRESMLFTFHDAFDGQLQISEKIAESLVAEFCSSLGASYQREPNLNNRDPGATSAASNGAGGPARDSFCGRILVEKIVAAMDGKMISVIPLV
jgi:hypothetical protein